MAFCFGLNLYICVLFDELSAIFIRLRKAFIILEVSKPKLVSSIHFKAGGRQRKILPAGGKLRRTARS
jgi:hypothetical protein